MAQKATFVAVCLWMKGDTQGQKAGRAVTLSRPGGGRGTQNTAFTFLSYQPEQCFGAAVLKG